MGELTFLLLYLSLPLFICFMQIVIGDHPLSVSLVGLCSWAIYLFGAVGSLPLYYGLDSYRFEIGISEASIVATALLYTAMSLLFLFSGALLGRLVLQNRHSRYRQFAVGSAASSEAVLLLVVAAVGVMAFAVYANSYEQLALVEAVSGGQASVSSIRSDMSNGSVSSVAGIRHAYTNLVQFATFGVTAYWLLRRTWASAILAISVTMVSSLILLASAEKAPVIWLFLGVVITFILAKGRGRLRLSFLLPVIFVSVGLIIGLYVLFHGYSADSRALTAILSRATMGTLTPAYFYLEYFPHVSPFLHGASLPNPGGIFDFRPVSVSVEIMNWAFPHYAATGVVGSSPTIFWGEAYANFGVIGIPVVATLIGIQLVLVEFLALRLSWGSFRIAMLVWLIIYYKDLAISGFSKYIFNFPLILIFIVVAACQFLLMCATTRPHSEVPPIAPRT